MSDIPLKYLFTAFFADGEKIVQEPDDRSLIEPEKRSRFFDVLRRAETVPLVAFVLSGNGHQYGVNLDDGSFEIDGVWFKMHEEELNGFELIFFRQHTHSFNVQKEENVELSHEVVYRIGWKLIGDQTKQRVMQIE